MKSISFFSTFVVIVLSLTAFRGLPVGIPPASKAPDAVQKVVIQSLGNELKFAQTEFTVASGREVNLVFQNNASVQGMAHNVVILDSEEAIDRVGLAAISAVENDYIPADEAILFHTPLAAPGEVVEVTFVAPEAGTYYYACTFPGHYVLMRGVMKVV